MTDADDDTAPDAHLPPAWRGRPSNPEECWNGTYGHLYDDFAKCGKCRFYAKDPAIVAAHEVKCLGRVIMTGMFTGWFCGACRFDGQSREELNGHYDRHECVDELGAIMLPLWQLDYDYDVLDEMD